MKRVLGSKTSATTDATWRAVLASPFEYITKVELDDYVKRSLVRIERCQEEYGPRFATAWSGGKDSLVTYDLARRQSSLGMYSGTHTDLEYPAFLQYLHTHMPKDVVHVFNGLDVDWLFKHPKALWPYRFPKERAKLNVLWNAPKWKTQKKFFADRALSFMVFGRRTIDSNFCGPKGTDGVTVDAKGFVGVNIIHDWPHEAVCAYIAVRGLALPPAYHQPGGFKRGVRSWAMDPEEVMREMDPELYAQWKPITDKIRALS